MDTGHRGLSTYRLVYTSLMICAVLLGTVIFRIPIPMTQGYVHLGDTMIFLGVLLLGKKEGAAAAGLGSPLADILGGYAFWAPWTLLIKIAMAYISGFLIEKAELPKHAGSFRKRELAVLITSMTAGGLVMCAGYLAAERIMYGSWTIAALSLPWNIGQFVTGIVVAAAAKPLCERINISR